MIDKIEINSSFSNTIERNRILSDNYVVWLEGEISQDNNYSKPFTFKINLSDYGLKSFKWESRDEIETRNVCTRLEEIATVKHKGYDIELAWQKNAPDLMKIALDQHDMQYGKTKPIDSNLSTSTQMRTELSKVGSPSEKKNIISTSKSILDNSRIFYNQPKFKILVEIQHINTQKEKYEFIDVSLYKPSQNVSDNSSEIEESIKVFSPILNNISDISPYNPITNSLAYKMLDRYMTQNPPSEGLGELDRKIIHSDLRNL